MTATNHAVTGAVIAAVVRQPLWAVPLAFLSHFVMDAIPHFGIDEAGDDVHARNRQPAFKWVLRIDMVLAPLCLMFLPWLLQDIVAWYVTLACSLAAMAPDLVWVYRYFREIRTGGLIPKNRFSRFHSWLQHERPRGIVLEIGWLLASLVVVAKLI